MFGTGSWKILVNIWSIWTLHPDRFSAHDVEHGSFTSQICYAKSINMTAAVIRMALKNCCSEKVKFVEFFFEVSGAAITTVTSPKNDSAMGV